MFTIGKKNKVSGASNRLGPLKYYGDTTMSAKQMYLTIRVLKIYYLLNLTICAQYKLKLYVQYHLFKYGITNYCILR